MYNETVQHVALQLPPASVEGTSKQSSSDRIFYEFNSSTAAGYGSFYAEGPANVYNSVPIPLADFYGIISNAEAYGGFGFVEGDTGTFCYNNMAEVQPSATTLAALMNFNTPWDNSAFPTELFSIVNNDLSMAADRFLLYLNPPAIII